MPLSRDHSAGADYLEERSKDALVSTYGHDPADQQTYNVRVPPGSQVHDEMEAR